jgi:hypothetical protein
MGEAGRLTRVIGPCFRSCLLSYGTADGAGQTAPGQLTVTDMADVYHLNAVGPHTAVFLHVGTRDVGTGGDGTGGDEVTAVAARAQARSRPGAELHVAVTAPPHEVDEVGRALTKALPSATVIVS